MFPEKQPHSSLSFCAKTSLPPLVRFRNRSIFLEYIFRLLPCGTKMFFLVCKLKQKQQPDPPPAAALHHPDIRQIHISKYNAINNDTK